MSGSRRPNPDGYPAAAEQTALAKLRILLREIRLQLLPRHQDDPSLINICFKRDRSSARGPGQAPPEEEGGQA